MQPAARIAAAIEILDDIEASIRNGGPPADRCVATYMRGRRYIGSKDRRAVSSYVYAVLRQRGKLFWLLGQANSKTTGRGLMIAHLATNDAPESLSMFGGEGAHAPDALSDMEANFADSISGENTPEPALLELPDVAREAFEKRFGEALPEAMEVLNREAPVGLRINSLKADDHFIENFKREFQNIEKTKFSPIGISSSINLPLQNHVAYRDGLIEVQDEAAQVASYLVDAKPGMAVVDLCAGAGGKSLLMAALMKNQGKIDAFDVGAARLKNLSTRAKRAGASIINTHVIANQGEQRYGMLNKYQGKADRVVIDAPCSGTGTWRRNPDQRWRLTEADIKSYVDLQYQLLMEGRELVAPGGRLIYMTCSLLPDENEAVVKRFIENSGLRIMLWQQLWQETLHNSPQPESLSSLDECLQLAPHLHGTDGFFIAVFEC